MTGTASAALSRDLEKIVGPAGIRSASDRRYLTDATEARGLDGHADAVALPATAEQAARIVELCYGFDIPIVPRGGGTGFAGGAVPDGGVVVSTERLRETRSFDPLLWRMEVEAGLTTWDVRRLARESGLLFPPDPGAGEQSHIGGNVATNAGGPHAFKYGVTGRWVTGLEVVLPPGEIVRIGGATWKDVAGYDLKSLLVGSEGTLGIVTAVWLRLIPAPEAAHPVVALYDSPAAGCAAIEAVLGNDIRAATLEYLDGGTLGAAAGSYPGALPAEARFMVISEADGSAAEAARVRDELVEVLREGALAVGPAEAAPLWRWRDGVSIAVAAQRGGKVSEDVAVPLDRLAEAIGETVAIGAEHGLEAVSWGHAGDGNLHSTFLIRKDDAADVAAAESASAALFELALRLGGTVSGEHGLGLVKRGHAGWHPRIQDVQSAVKDAFDPKGLLNPGKKL